MATTPEKIFSEVERGASESRKYFKRVGDEIAALNNYTQGRVTRLYDAILGMLELNPSTGIPMDSVKNFSMLGSLTNGLQPIFDVYRKKYASMMRSNRDELIGLTADKEGRVGRLFKSIGVDGRKAVSGIDRETFDIMKTVHDSGLVKINRMLEDWKDYAYEVLQSGIVRGLPVFKIRENLFNTNGSIRVGSSLDEKSTQATMTSLTEQRTTFLRRDAKKNGYTYCWNNNPMDLLTKPICAQATLAGVISEQQMGEEFGFPPRFVCRCDVTYTRPEWTSVNRSVNKAIDDRRQKLFKELWDSPKSFQKKKWKRAGKWVAPVDDILRLQGKKYYTDVKEKLEILANPVPVYGEEVIGATGFPVKEVAKKADDKLAKMRADLEALRAKRKASEKALASKKEDVRKLKRKMKNVKGQGENAKLRKQADDLKRKIRNTKARTKRIEKKLDEG